MENRCRMQTSIDARNMRVITIMQETNTMQEKKGNTNVTIEEMNERSRILEQSAYRTHVIEL